MTHTHTTHYKRFLFSLSVCVVRVSAACIMRVSLEDGIYIYLKKIPDKKKKT